MTNRSRPLKTSRIFSLAGMRSRRAERRSRLTGHRNPSPTNYEDCDDFTSDDHAHDETRTPSSNYLAGMMAERSAILSRIESLQSELSKEQKDLRALDVVLSRIAPMNTASDSPAPRRRAKVDFVDVDFEVIQRGES